MYDGAIPAGGQSRHMQSSLAHIASADAVHPAIPLRSKKTRMILAGRWRRWSVCEKTLLVVFLLSLPLCNPWLRGDGIGYYAYARALLIDHNLRFEKDYFAGNADFVQRRVDETGRFKPEFYTRTGYLENHFTVGPAILWAPFMVSAHVAALVLRMAGFPVNADGFTFPYRWAMALGTAVYGFLGLWISFHLARKYVAERWAFLATLGIWWGSSLPVYMYFNPSWSHAHSAFSVALFLWYWHRTRDARTTRQWIVLGWLAALMTNVYYLNAVLLTAPGIEALLRYRQTLWEPDSSGPSAGRLLGQHAVFAVAVLAGMLPTLLTRQIIYGSPFESGYAALGDWHWGSPEFLRVLFSADHGMLSWTPLLGLALAGLVLFGRREKTTGGPLIGATVAFYLFISAYPDWDGLSSFGNRFFISLTPIFVLGLAALLGECSGWFVREKMTLAGGASIVALFVVWNLGFIFQWGLHLVPARGPISWRRMAHNQVMVVPSRFGATVRDYLFGRKAMMQRIEEQDIQQQKLQKPPDS